MVVISHVESQKDILFADPEKVRVIKEWLVPVVENQLRAFLGGLLVTMFKLYPLCTAHYKKGTVLKGQLSVRESSWT